MTLETTAQQRRVTVAGLLIVLMLGALDQTVVATAMPRIISELGGIELYAWVTTVYLLSSTVSVPIWGKLGDLYGRKPVLITGVLIFIVGSCLCGLAGEFGELPLLGGGMTQLIVFRGLQGIGGGALFTSAFAIIADLYPPRERSKLSGYFGAMFGLASLIGPVIGGFLTDHATVQLGGLTVAGWRWCFYVNLPLSLLALFMIWAKMPGLVPGRGGRIDWLGAILLIGAFVPLLLALSWGGHQHPWGSSLILSLLGVTAVSLGLFLWVETKAPEPIVPLSLFGIRVFSTANAASFVVSMSFMGTATFLPLYLQLGLGVPATQSGVVMLPMMFGMIATATVSGRLVARTGRYKPVMLAGGVLLLAVMLLLTQLGPDTDAFGLSWRMFLLGVSLGPAQSLFNVAVQNAVPMERMGVATSSSQFFRQIGSTVGTAVFGAVMTTALAVHMGAVAGPGGRPMTLDALQAMAIEGHQSGVRMVVDPAVRAAFSAAMGDMFWAAVGIAAVGVLLILLIPEIPLRITVRPEPVAEPGEGEGGRAAV